MQSGKQRYELVWMSCVGMSLESVGARCLRAQGFGVVLWMLVAVLRGASARRDAIDVVSSDKVMLLAEPFGFVPEGELSVQLFASRAGGGKGIPNNLLCAVLFSDSQLEDLLWQLERNEHSDVICRMPSAMRFAFEDSLTVEGFRVRELDRYYLCLINCYRETLRVRGEWKTLNPPVGTHLSYEQIQEVDVYFPLIFAYGLLLFFMVCVSMLIRRLTILQYFLLLVLFIKAVSVESLELYMARLGLTGNSSGYILMRTVPKVISDVAILHLILWLASGESTVVHLISFRERAFLGGVRLVYVLLDVVALAAADRSLMAFLYKLAFQFYRAMLALYVVALMNIAAENMRRVFYFEDAVVPSTGSTGAPCAKWAVTDKIRFFQFYRWVFSCFLLSTVLLLFLDVAILQWYQRWILLALQEFVELVVLIMLCASMRPHRRFSWPNDRTVQNHFRSLRRTRRRGIRPLTPEEQRLQQEMLQNAHFVEWADQEREAGNGQGDASDRMSGGAEVGHDSENEEEYEAEGSDRHRDTSLVDATDGGGR